MFKYIRQHCIVDPTEYVGKDGEITSTDDGMLYRHDGVTVGGIAFPRTVTMKLTKAQINAISSSPITVIPAPGASSYVVVLLASLALVHQSPEYIANDHVWLYYGDTTEATAIASPLDGPLSAEQSCMTVSGPLGESGSPSFISIATNAPIVLNSASDPISGGTGSYAVLTVVYQTITIPA